MSLPLPTKRDEAWRYSDLDAAATLWPVGPGQAINVAAGERAVCSLIRVGAVDAVTIDDYAIVLEAGARLDFHIVNAGARFGRIAIDVTLHEGAHFELGGAQIGGGESTLEIVTTVRHIEPGATSRQIVRNILGGQATGSYLGKVAVARDAQKTDSVQSVKAMLLTRTATANAKPELEIYADDVKCAHGATVGELDQASMFYLASRGLEPIEARNLLLRAFLAEAFAGAEAQDALEEAALGALERLA